MSTDATSRPWGDLADYYRAIGTGQSNMVALVEVIAASPFAIGIFGATSMHTLLISQTPMIALWQNVLRVNEWDREFVFEYVEEPSVVAPVANPLSTRGRVQVPREFPSSAAVVRPVAGAAWMHKTGSRPMRRVGRQWEISPRIRRGMFDTSHPPDRSTSGPDRR